MEKQTINVAILDLYDNEPNHGIRCIKELVTQSDAQLAECSVKYRVYKVRYKAEVPGMDHDIYISTGGPGSPFDGEGKVWEKKFFTLIEKIWHYNQDTTYRKKYIFFICHSFHMMTRLFELAKIQARTQISFGIMPVYKTEEGRSDPLLAPLPQPYYAADFRQFEVIDPDRRKLESLGAKILSWEQRRVDPTLPQAVMAIRISDEIVGTQYHPEAEPKSMLYHFRQPGRPEQVIAEHGKAKYKEMLRRLGDSANILLTRKTILPTFLNDALNRLYHPKCS